MIVYIADIVLIFTLRNDDYTTNTFKKIFKLVVSCLVLSTLASVFSFNVYLGSIITLIVSFYIYYFFSHENKLSSALFFVNYYMLILTFPIGIKGYPLRIGVTLYGLIFTFIIYFAVFARNHKNKDKKTVLDNTFVSNKEDETYHKLRIKNIMKTYSHKYALGYRLKLSMSEFKFNHAIKGSILIALTTFIVYRFNIPLGKWILYSIIISNAPFAEKGIRKARDRVFGTVIGFIAVIIVFNLTHSTFIITVLIALSLYVVFCIPTYDIMAIFITFAVISGFVLLDHTNFYLLSIERLGLVLIGCISVYLVIKFIYPYKGTDSYQLLIEKFKVLNNEIKKAENGDKEKIYELNIIIRELIVKGEFLKGQFNLEKLNTVLEIERTLALYLNEYYTKNNDISIKNKINEKLIEFEEFTSEKKHFTTLHTAMS
ncbi:MAG: FUSC family protein [Sarcina sp.]